MEDSGLFGTFKPKPVKESPSHQRRYSDYGSNWKELANTCLLLANYICHDCKTKPATNAHHIVPLKNGGVNQQYNLRALCFHCHSKYHSHLGRRKTDIMNTNNSGLY
jgi:5-methylcytosine-specific restriction endonuclease McrA